MFAQRSSLVLERFQNLAPMMIGCWHWYEPSQAYQDQRSCLHNLERKKLSLLIKQKRLNEISAFTHRNRVLILAPVKISPISRQATSNCTATWSYRTLSRKIWLVGVTESFVRCEINVNSPASRFPSKAAVGSAARILENEETFGEMELNFVERHKDGN